MLLLAGCALTAAGAASPLGGVTGSLLSLASVYGYPVLLVFVSPMRISAFSRRLALASIGALAILFVVACVMGSVRGDGGGDAPAWTYPIGAAAGASIFVTLVVVARALRRLELNVGRNIPLGGLSAFLWLVYWPVGTYFFHKRLRRALELRTRNR